MTGLERERILRDATRRYLLGEIAYEQLTAIRRETDGPHHGGQKVRDAATAAPQTSKADQSRGGRGGTGCYAACVGKEQSEHKRSLTKRADLGPTKPAR